MPSSHSLSVCVDGRQAETSECWMKAMLKQIYRDPEATGSVSHVGDPILRPFERAKIFSVPQYLREVQPAAYAPFILVMGPYHREYESAEISERKIFSAKQRLDRFQVLHKYVEENNRNFTEMYDRKINIKSEPLSLMLALDASFLSDILVEYEKRHYPLQTETYNDYVLPRRHFWPILRDLMLMENQIPIGILRKALESRKVSQDSQDPLQDPVYKLVSYIYPFRTKVRELPHINFGDCHHLLDCLYQVCTWKGVVNDPKALRSDVQIPTANQLLVAGIHLKPTGEDLCSIKFDGSTLHLPVIRIYSDTESWFRNLMAYEQCRNDLSVHWCSYMRLMACLIDTPEDVKLLTK